MYQFWFDWLTYWLKVLLADSFPSLFPMDEFSVWLSYWQAVQLDVEMVDWPGNILSKKFQPWDKGEKEE